MRRNAQERLLSFPALSFFPPFCHNSYFLFPFFSSRPFSLPSILLSPLLTGFLSSSPPIKSSKGQENLEGMALHLIDLKYCAYILI